MESDKFRPLPKSPHTLIFFLLAVAVALTVVGVASGVTALAVATTPPASRAMLMLAVLSLFGAAAAVLWALAWLCRSTHEQALALRRLASAMDRLSPAPPAADGVSVVSAEAPPKSPAAPPADGSGEAVRLEMVLEQLRELNVNVLLSEPQRREKHRRVVEREVRELAAGVGQAVEAGDLAAAESQLQLLARLSPDHVEIPRLNDRIERGRADAEARDIAGATRRVEDLMSTGDFDEAQAAADGLLARHPSSAQAIALMDRVQRERQALLDERRARMYGQVEKAAAERHWRAALAAAKEFIEAFPDCHEAEGVRVQLETLTDNARIEEVRELRDSIADLIDRRRFAEALALARDVVERFPGTAAAAELRGQMSRLAERAREGGDRPG